MSMVDTISRSLKAAWPRAVSLAATLSQPRTDVEASDAAFVALLEESAIARRAGLVARAIGAAWTHSRARTLVERSAGEFGAFDAEQWVRAVSWMVVVAAALVLVLEAVRPTSTRSAPLAVAGAVWRGIARRAGRRRAARARAGKPPALSVTPPIRLLVLSPIPEEGAGCRFRIAQFIPYLEANGFEVTLSTLFTTDFFRLVYRPGHYLRRPSRSPRCRSSASTPCATSRSSTSSSSTARCSRSDRR